MQELRKSIEKIKRTKSSVLITAETGSGKENVARQLRSTLGTEL